MKNPKAYAEAFVDLHGSTLVGMRIMVCGASEEATAIESALAKLFDTDVARPEAVCIELGEALQAGEVDVVINVTGEPLPFAVPAWVTAIDLRDEYEGKAVLVKMVQNMDNQTLGHHHHDDHCHCHDDHCTCGEHHHD